MMFWMPMGPETPRFGSIQPGVGAPGAPPPGVAWLFQRMPLGLEPPGLPVVPQAGRSRAVTRRLIHRPVPGLEAMRIGTPRGIWSADLGDGSPWRRLLQASSGLGVLLLRLQSPGKLRHFSNSDSTLESSSGAGASVERHEFCSSDALPERCTKSCDY